MATVSVRVEDDIKDEAEHIANSIGLTLSSAISIFLNRFVAEQGFPFPVTVLKKERVLINSEELIEIFNSAIKANAGKLISIQSTYLDSDDSLKQTK